MATMGLLRTKIVMFVIGILMAFSVIAITPDAAFAGACSYPHDYVFYSNNKEWKYVFVKAYNSGGTHYHVYDAKQRQSNGNYVFYTRKYYAC